MKGSSTGVLGLLAFIALLAAFAVGRCSGGSADSAEAGSQESDEASEASDAVWTCSMHPEVRRDAPGTCPLCGMELALASSGVTTIGPTEVHLSERARALAAVRTEVVRAREGGPRTARFVARVEIDETRLALVTSWTTGRIDRLHVRATGQRVERGQVVATIYSPEIYAAHQDLLAARRHAERVAEGPLGEASQVALESARERLRLLGVESDALTEMEQASRPARQVPVRSQASGTVIERVATQGAYVAAGGPLFRIARLDSVWAKLEVYERDLASLRAGQPVTLRFPGRRTPSEGRIVFVEPILDARRRVAEVRVVLDNRDGSLRPGVVGEAEVSLGPSGHALDVPATALLYTGRRALVYVEREPGVYEAREVSVGARRGRGDGARVSLLEGLREGERVVVHGAFVVDAELQIRGGASMMARDGDSARVELDAAERALLAPVVEAALSVAEALAASDAEAARGHARALEEALPALADEGWSALAAGAREHANAITRAADLDAMRVRFEPLSLTIEAVLARYGNPTSGAVRVAYCPMAFDDRGARWVQRAERVDNAYFGDAMRTCGTFEVTLAPGEHLRAETLR